MNRSQKAAKESGKAASHYQPLLGMYDSLDKDVVECHLIWMKAAGFDGILADWYGIHDYFDYAMIHERTKFLFNAAEKVGMKIGVVYEDQTVKHAVDKNLLAEADSERIAKETGEWLKQNWLQRRSWLKLGKNPSLFVFGPQKFKEKEWSFFRSGSGTIDLLTLHHPQPYGDGVYDWPVPAKGNEFQKTFLARSSGSELIVSIAYPRFHDFYEEGGQTGYADLPDNNGKTFTETLSTALSQNPIAIQVATWNDWQEGTQIEPSVEFGYRDLAELQSARRKLDSNFKYTKRDFDFGLKVYELRKKKKQTQQISKAVDLFHAGSTDAAWTLLDRASTNALD